MDTLFRLVAFHPAQQSFNSGSSPPSKHAYPYHNLYTTEEDEECSNLNASNRASCGDLYMDEDDYSSSFGPQAQPTTSAATTITSTTSYSTLATSQLRNQSSKPADITYPHGIELAASASWASELLNECARAVSARDTARVQQLMWMLNELSSPYGDPNQKIAAYFLQALLARMTSAGAKTIRTLASAYDRNCSFDSTRRTALQFQEVSPWSTFGHVASNGAILEALEGESRVHILDLSNTFCTQWPTLLEAMATRTDDAPHLRLTAVIATPRLSAEAGSSSSVSGVQRVMNEIGARLEKFARLMGVPFKFRAIHHAGDLAALDLDSLVGRTDFGDEALAVNCVNALHGVRSGPQRNSVFARLRRLRPKIVTVVEEEADMGPHGGDYARVFGETLRFFSAFFDSLDQSFHKTSNERLSLERAAGKAIVDLVACEAEDSTERRETGASWSERMRAAGFSPVSLSDDAADDVRSLLRRYRDGWSLTEPSEVDSPASGIFLSWKMQPVVWASAWKP
ncbi:GRAS family transcription factor [Wolffia australiana]